MRPGLEMTGYFDYYTPERIQLLGMKEWSYLAAMPAQNRYQVLKKMFLPETPAVIVGPWPGGTRGNVEGC